MAVFAPAFVGGALGALPVYVMGLVVPMSVVWPLTLGSAALVSTVAAGWTANLLERGRTWSRLPVVLVFSGVVAGVVAAASLLFFYSPLYGTFLFGPGVYSVTLAAAVIALGATIPAFRYRRRERKLARDVVVMLVVLLSSPVIVAGAMALSCNILVRCGA